MLGNFAESTPEAVRMFASGMVMFGAGAVSQDLPQATGWISSLSQFINTGGTFKIELAPETELTASDFPGSGPETGMTGSPDLPGLVSLLGLSVTHTPASETAAGSP